MAQVTYPGKILHRYTVNENGCWIYKGSLHSGYSQIMIGGKNLLVHRVAYELLVGPIPPKMLVCHKCDVRNCINPGHLFIGTQSDNIQDCIKKGRFTQATWGKKKCPK